MNVTFVLVEPAVSENIGAAARAIKTMGFHSLALIRPRAELDERAYKLAHGSADILDNCRIFPNLEDVLQNQNLIIGTSAKKRNTGLHFVPSTKLGEYIIEHSSEESSIAVVFGREDRGLLNEELSQCHITCGIPLQTKHPSLNLGQSVMLIAYELSNTLYCKNIHRKDNLQDSSLNVISSSLHTICISAGIDGKRETKLSRFLASLNRGNLNFAAGIIRQLEHNLSKK